MEPTPSRTLSPVSPTSPVSRVPFVLLDVDGVINAVSGRGDPSVWQDWRSGRARAGGRTWPILWSPTVTGTIRRWHATGLAEVRWLTTWRDEANETLRELVGLPPLTVVGSVAHEVPAQVQPAPDPAVASHAEVAGADAPSLLTGRWWKFDLVLELVAADPSRPFVWLDDDLRTKQPVREWLAGHTTSLTLAPPAHTGLTPRLLAEAEEWLRAHHPDAAPG